MATKKTNKSTQKEDKGYTVGRWNGMPKYMCDKCPFDTLDEGVIIRHIEDEHTVKPPKPVAEARLFDRFGNELIKKDNQ